MEYYLWQFHSPLKRTVIYNWAEHSHWKHWSNFLSVMVKGTPKKLQRKSAIKFQNESVRSTFTLLTVYTQCCLIKAWCLMNVPHHLCSRITWNLFSKISLPSKITLWPIWPAKTWSLVCFTSQQKRKMFLINHCILGKVFCNLSSYKRLN